MRKYIKDLNTWKLELSVYDIDDTLIRSTSKIRIEDKRTGKVGWYTTRDLIDFEEQDYYDVNFDGFDDKEHLIKGELIHKYVKKIVSDFKNGKAIAIVTGRKNKETVKILDEDF